MTDSQSEAKITQKILDIKESLGDALYILTHHYQRKEIVELGDIKGDSFDLSKRAAANDKARYIVFCGVHFMAESAAILAQGQQTVQIPDLEAGCWMAEMADSVVVQKAWEEIEAISGKNVATPIVYMNSDVGMKAFCGENGGTVCTSSNAYHAFEWGFKQREKIFFFPDQHLGRNTGNKLGISPDKMIVWNPDEPLGGNSEEEIKRSKIILWDGYCLVHSRFTTEHITSMRNKYPEAKIVVHPECTEDVVKLADANGSTSFIVKYVDEAPDDATIIVGTEINMIHRLNSAYSHKRILPLFDSLCPNMYKIDRAKLLHTLENIGQVNIVKVEKELKIGALKALDRMLSLNPQ